MNAMFIKSPLLLLVLLFCPAAAQEMALPSNPLKGRIVFEEKGCIECHAISGFGGTAGPDLATDHDYGSFFELASMLWNHFPQMNRKYRELRLERPGFTQTEMRDLTGFFYYLRYLGEPGSVSRGRQALLSKGCLNCHTMTGTVRGKGPDFSDIRRHPSPVYVIQAMWNHAPEMQREMRSSGRKYPLISGRDVNDITAYLREAASGPGELLMSPGSPSKGKLVFEQKQCKNCHSVNGETSSDAPNLREIKLNKSVTEVAASMWNHSPEMLDFMREDAIEWPVFAGHEMADLIAYLYFLGFEDKPGNPLAGEEVFVDKGCATCHEKGGEGDGPDLSELWHVDSPFRMMQLMWNHAPKMEDKLLVQNEQWPQLSAQEMRDFYAYLKTIVDTTKRGSE